MTSFNRLGPRERSLAIKSAFAIHYATGDGNAKVTFEDDRRVRRTEIVYMVGTAYSPINPEKEFLIVRNLEAKFRMWAIPFARMVSMEKAT